MSHLLLKNALIFFIILFSFNMAIAQEDKPIDQPVEEAREIDTTAIFQELESMQKSAWNELLDSKTLDILDSAYFSSILILATSENIVGFEFVTVAYQYVRSDIGAYYVDYYEYFNNFGINSMFPLSRGLLKDTADRLLNASTYMESANNAKALILMGKALLQIDSDLEKLFEKWSYLFWDLVKEFQDFNKTDSL